MKNITLLWMPIPLSQGLFALVDASDYGELSKFRWYISRKGTRLYAKRNTSGKDGKRKTVYMHRAILGASSGIETDHRNHNGLDNRRQNLRPCTCSENQQNKKSQRNSSSIYKGVSWDKRYTKWRAGIMLNGRTYHLGYRKTERECAQLYDIAAEKLFGKFACLNFPQILLDKGKTYDFIRSRKMLL